MIFVEKEAYGGHYSRSFDKNGVLYQVVDSYRDIEDSKENILITASSDRYIHACPGTKEYRCCNYHVLDIVHGCPYNCSYCILQSYLDHDYVKVYDHVDEIRKEIFTLNKRGKFRLGSGELSDSLALDDTLKLTETIIPVVNSLDNIQFEFKTKSAVVERLFNLNPKNIVVSWSLNPQEIANNEEKGAASLESRLLAARLCQEYGYKISLHLDPLIYDIDFPNNYFVLIEDIARYLNEDMIEYISVSSFRCMPGLIDIIRQYHPGSNLLSVDYIKGLDGKMRYFKTTRVYMLRCVINEIKKYFNKTFIYFCMEHSSVWEKLLGDDPGDRIEFEKKFPWNKI